VAWTGAAKGLWPSVPSKLCNVVKVCAGKAAAVAAQRAIAAHSLFNASAICFKLVLLDREDCTAKPCAPWGAMLPGNSVFDAD
jgi:hypothetical protein